MTVAIGISEGTRTAQRSRNSTGKVLWASNPSSPSSSHPCSYILWLQTNPSPISCCLFFNLYDLYSTSSLMMSALCQWQSLCVVTHIARVWINQVRLPDLHVVSWTGKITISLSAFVPENFVSRDGFGSPVPRQPAHLHTQAESGAYLRDSSRVPRRHLPTFSFLFGSQIYRLTFETCAQVRWQIFY